MPAQTLTIVKATGQDECLAPLTLHRAKAAVPFGGKFRIIDFTLANCLHSCLLYTSPSPRDRTRSRMPSSA